MQHQDNFWYKHWFNDKYLLLYPHRNTQDARQQLELYLRHAAPDKNDRLLDLCCGQGRHCAILHNHGYKVEGLDLSKSLLRVAREKHPQITFHQSDMRNIPGKFNQILSLFTSFGYFETDRENEEIIRNIYKALYPGGIFWLDFLNAQHLKSSLDTSTREYHCKEMLISERKSIQDKRIRKQITITGPAQKKETYLESIRLFTREELEKILKNKRLQPLKVFGDYHGADWRPDSPRTIIMSTRDEA